MDYSTLYKVLFESTCKGAEGTFGIDSENEKQVRVLKEIFSSMHETITTKNEDVVQTVDVLEYFLKILTDISCKWLLKHALKLILEILKGDFIIKGLRPFKSFY